MLLPNYLPKYYFSPTFTDVFAWPSRYPLVSCNECQLSKSDHNFVLVKRIGSRVHVLRFLYHCELSDKDDASLRKLFFSYSLLFQSALTKSRPSERLINSRMNTMVLSKFPMWPVLFGRLLHWAKYGFQWLSHLVQIAIMVSRLGY